MYRKPLRAATHAIDQDPSFVSLISLSPLRLPCPSVPKVFVFTIRVPPPDADLPGDAERHSTPALLVRREHHAYIVSSRTQGAVEAVDVG